MLPFDNSRRSRTTQIEILKAFAGRLCEIDGLNNQIVVISEQPIPEVFPNGQLCIAVSIGDGKFPNSSHSIMTEDATLTIGIYRISKKDRPGRSEAKLLGDSSLFEWKQKVLAKICVEDPTLGDLSSAWEPTKVVNGYRVPLLREPPLPTNSVGPFDVTENKGWAGLQLHWSIVFDWDLYGRG